MLLDVELDDARTALRHASVKNTVRCPRCHRDVRMVRRVPSDVWLPPFFSGHCQNPRCDDIWLCPLGHRVEPRGSAGRWVALRERNGISPWSVICQQGACAEYSASWGRAVRALFDPKRRYDGRPGEWIAYLERRRVQVERQLSAEQDPLRQLVLRNLKNTLLRDIEYKVWAAPHMSPWRVYFMP